MTQDEIEGRARDCMVARWGFMEEQLVREASLNALGVDSLDVIEMVMTFETEFGVDIPDEAIDGRLEDHTVGDLLDVALKYAPRQQAA